MANGLMEVNVEFVGLESLIQKMKAMPAHIQADADDQIGEVAEGMARSVASQYRQGPTGKLKRGVRAVRMGVMQWRVRSGAPHAHLVEFGTRPRRTKKGASRGSMPRYGPIFGVEKMRWRGVFLDRMRSVLRNAGRGAGSPGGGGLL